MAYDYDNAPTDPHHGGKLTADMMDERKACGNCDLHSEEGMDGFGICNLEIARRTLCSHVCDLWKPRVN